MMNISVIDGAMLHCRLCTEHNQRYLYMLFEYVGGGELFTYLRNAGRFETNTAMFYAAEITLVFDYLHSLAIVYRDLKPENLLLDREGHLKICDFGFAKKLNDRCDAKRQKNTPVSVVLPFNSLTPTAAILVQL